MSAIRFLLPIVAAFTLAACTHTTVVLLPDEDGKVGAVSVRNPAGERTVDRAYGYTSIGVLSDKPSDVRQSSAEKVNEQYGSTLRAQPSKPASFILYFELGGSELTPESLAMLPKVLTTVRERSPTRISIIGHTDSIGTEAVNAKISMERAQTVERLLREAHPNLGPVDLRFFGEKDPLIRTPSNVPEPRNRRVEIMIL